MVADELRRDAVDITGTTPYGSGMPVRVSKCTYSVSVSPRRGRRSCSWPSVAGRVTGTYLVVPCLHIFFNHLSAVKVRSTDFGYVSSQISVLIHNGAAAGHV